MCYRAAPLSPRLWRRLGLRGRHESPPLHASPMSFANHRVRAERAATRPLAAGCGEREGGREREGERERDTSMDVRSLYVR